MAWRMELGHVALTVRLPVLRRIGSSGHRCSDRFRLDQLPWPVPAERHCTMMNCNLVHDSWAQPVAVFKIANATTPFAALTCPVDDLLIRQAHGHPAHIHRERSLVSGVQLKYVSETDVL